MDIHHFDQDFYGAQTFQGLAAQGGALDYIEFEDCTFKDCQFFETVFTQCKFVDCTFVRCDLHAMAVPMCRFLGVVFEDCQVMSVAWPAANWPRISSADALRFRQCDISASSFSGLALEGLVVEDCKAHAVDFRGGAFPRARFSYSDLSGSMFAKTDLTAGDFTDSMNYDIDIFHNILSKASFSRDEATRLLYCMDINLVD